LQATIVKRQISPQALSSAGVYALAAAVVLVFWALAHLWATGSAGVGARTTAAGVVGVAAGVLGVGVLTLAWRRAGPRRVQGFHVPVLANAIVLAACVALLEAAARIVSRPHQLSTSIGSIALVPYEWEAVRAFNKGLLERSRAPSSFYVDSNELGWTIGSSRRSSRGTYQSSVEGLRSARQGEELLLTSPAVRVALFGDSFAFSEEVAFDQSLNAHLERRLGAGSQVLNFGVPGFGIDQAVLRFELEAARWKPQVSILQFIADDIDRIGHVYLFNRPDWAFPFVKPRFLLADGGLRRAKIPTADEVYATPVVFEIPYLDLDAGFDERRWRAPIWSWSYLARFVVSRALGHSGHVQKDGASNERIAVAMIERFIVSARAIGSVPVVVYFPDHRNLDGLVSESAGRVLAALAQRGVDVLDTTKCMRDAGGTRELVVGGGPEARRASAPAAPKAGDIETGAWVHYSDTGNARMAECMAPRLQQALSPQNGKNDSK
jgi:hypothetical protein